MDLHHANWDGLPWKRVREGVERKAFSGSGGTMAMNRLMPGHEPRPHSHSHEQMVYIVSGEIDFHGAPPRAVTSKPPGPRHCTAPLTHWGEVVGNKPVLNLDVFTPRRAEYT